MGLGEFRARLLADSDAHQPSEDALSAGRRYRPGLGLLPISLVRFGPGNSAPVNLLAGGHLQQFAGLRSTGRDGLCRGVFWCALAGPGSQTAPV